MKLDFHNERVLAVVAHPDDAELLCAGTLARAKQDGAAIGICVLCRGDKGQSDPPVDNLDDIRRKEMTAAADLLGADLLFGEFSDGELTDSSEVRLKLTQLYRVFRPTLVLAHWQEDYHADHRAASALAEAVSWFAASAGWKTSSSPLDEPLAVWWMDTVEMLGFEPHFFVDIGRFVALKHQMLACHGSQLRRGSESDFSPLDELLERQCRSRGAQSGVVAAEAFRTHSTWKRQRAW